MKLDDKYTQQSGSVYLTGIQALVRLPMDQMRRDRLAHLNTATFISGYEGSPLGAYDLALSRVPALLQEHHVHFVPGVNEEVAATSIPRQPDPPRAGRIQIRWRSRHLVRQATHCAPVAGAGDSAEART